MAKKSFLFLMILVVFILAQGFSVFAQEPSYAHFLGEVITYDVRSLAMKMADARIELAGPIRCNDRDAYLITFEAKGSNFHDKEKIYADAKDFYPLRVERDVLYLGSSEQIIEEYNQEKFTVTITKTTKAKPKAERMILQKKAKIDNLYCFIYRYRLNGRFQIGSSLRLNLPTQDVAVKVVKREALDAAGRSFDTFFLETTPAQYKIWFDTSTKKILLRVDKMAMVGGTRMTMSSYSFKGVSGEKTR